jgi:hypothetical protein
MRVIDWVSPVEKVGTTGRISRLQLAGDIHLDGLQNRPRAVVLHEAPDLNLQVLEVKRTIRVPGRRFVLRGREEPR